MDGPVVVENGAPGAGNFADSENGGGKKSEPMERQKSQQGQRIKPSSSSSSSSRPVSRSNSNSPRSLEPGSEEQESDVGTVLSRAKKAASSLWMLIHAQNCRMGADRCAHAGCSTAKIVLLHLKTCSATGSQPCPTGYHGCHQARKLLAHYRRCKNIRARQVGLRGQNNQHFCLVCSLVARQARTLLEGGRSSSSSRRNHSGPRTRVLSSFTLQQHQQHQSQGTCVKIPQLLSRRMHPPSSRMAGETNGSGAPESKWLNSSPDNECQSPSGNNHLVQFSEVVVAAASSAPEREKGFHSDTSNKSSFLTFAAGMLQQMKQAPPNSSSSTNGSRRIRAESFSAEAMNRRKQVAPNDPTLEADFHNGQFVPEEEQLEFDREAKAQRTRSVSLGVISEVRHRRMARREVVDNRSSVEQPFLMEEDL